MPHASSLRRLPPRPDDRLPGFAPPPHQHCDESLRTDLTDREQSPNQAEICACIYHIDLEQPADISIKEIICAGIQDTYLGTNLPSNNLVPVGKRRENWAYDNGNWTTHNKKTEINSQWVIGQRGDFERTMQYSKSDQPKTETITTFEDPTTRQYNIFHDKRGNLVDDGRKVFEYDALNRLTGVWQSAGGGQQGSTYSYGTKGHPIAAYTYDGYGHRLTARYNSNNNTIIDDDPVDVYAYDRLWRVRTVTRATPSGSSAEATWTYYVREKWYYHDTESGQEMMTGPASTDAPVLRLIDTNGDGDFTDTTDIEHHFVNDHQGSTVLVTGKATLNATTGELISRGPIIAHVKYDQYGTPKFVHPADVNSDGFVDAADLTFWKQAWNEYFHGTSGGEDSPPKEIWKGVADADESGAVDESADENNENLPAADNTDWLAFQALHTAGLIAEPLDQQLGNLPLYAGYWWDDAIGLYHVRHRVYRPEWGRWLQRDPLGYAPGWNLYQYVNGMPWSAVDPMGLAAPDFLDYLFGALQVVDEVLDVISSPFKGGGAGQLATEMDHGIRDKEETARDLRDSPYSDAADSYVGGLRNYQKGMKQAADMAETSVLFTIAPGLNIESGTLSTAQIRQGVRVVERNGKTFAKMADGRAIEISAAEAARLQKAAGSRRVVIGESMSRVDKAAKRYNAETFELTKAQRETADKITEKLGDAAAKEYIWRINQKWLEDKIARGYEIVDIGLDVDRAERGDFYRRESELLRSRRITPSEGYEPGAKGCVGVH